MATNHPGQVYAPRSFVHDITYWKSTGPAATTSTPSQDVFDGGYDFASPVKIKGRWVQETMNTLERGESRMASNETMVFVDQVMYEEDYLALGDHTSVNDPTECEDAFQIRKFTQQTSISGLHVQYRAYLHA